MRVCVCVCVRTCVRAYVRTCVAMCECYAYTGSTSCQPGHKVGQQDHRSPSKLDDWVWHVKLIRDLFIIDISCTTYR